MNSIALYWAASVVITITFLRGLLAFAEAFPFIALGIAAVVVGALIALSNDVAEL